MGALSHLDWAIVFAYMGLALAVGLVFTRRASRGIREYFISGATLPWWIVGTSMVATTFSTDTPNLVTQLVREDGVAGNWRWWCFVLTGVLTVFFFARLWRRAGVLTDLEFYELRYAGRPAAFLRAFRALAVGVVFNVLIMASVTLGATKIAHVLFGWEKATILGVCGSVALIYSVLSGFWGVVVTDLLQFAMAMVGAVGAAWFALGRAEVGGLSRLIARVPEKLTLLPEPGTPAFLSLIIVPFAVQWWSTWYPGAEPGGGSYVAQRMFSARDERQSLLATFWFNIAHYAVRPWPWILVALASILVYPTVADLGKAVPDLDPSLVADDIAYPLMLREVLPHGLLGICVASLIAAYMSTIDTHLNLGASYVINDIYKRFLRPEASARHYILISRIATIVLMMLAAAVSLLLESAAQSFDLLIGIFAGTGLVYILRWYWWRINAWSEIAAMATAVVFAAAFWWAAASQTTPALQIRLLSTGGPLTLLAWIAPGAIEIPSETRLLATAGATTVAWIIVTFQTAPTRRETLIAFFRKIRPPGPGWRPIAREVPDVRPAGRIAVGLACWALGVMAIYGALFGVGLLLYGYAAGGIAFCAVAVACVAAILRLLVRDTPRTDEA